MVLGVQMYGLLAKGNKTDREVLETVKRVGLVSVEPCINFDEDYKDSNPAFWSVEKFERLYPLIKEMGLEVVTCFVNAKSLSEASTKMCEMAQKYEIPYFILNMPSDLTMDGLKAAACSYRDLADSLAVYHSKPLLHNGKPDTEVFVNGKTAYEYMIEICDGKVMMEFDTGWCAAGGVDPITFLEKNVAFIEALHFKDFVDPGVSSGDVCIGSGTVDNIRAMQIGIEKKIPMFIDQDNYSDLEKDMRKSYDFLMNGGK